MLFILEYNTFQKDPITVLTNLYVDNIIYDVLHDNFGTFVVITKLYNIQ